MTDATPQQVSALAGVLWTAATDDYRRPEDDWAEVMAKAEHDIASYREIRDNYIAMATAVLGSPDLPERSARVNYLPLLDLHSLRAAVQPIADAWGTTAYLVGSVITRPDYRDVDVRLILDDAVLEENFRRPELRQLANVTTSAWLARMTGLPIDFQYQYAADSARLDGEPRQPLIDPVAMWKSTATPVSVDEHRMRFELPHVTSIDSGRWPKHWTPITARERSDYEQFLDRIILGRVPLTSNLETFTLQTRQREERHRPKNTTTQH